MRTAFLCANLQLSGEYRATRKITVASEGVGMLYSQIQPQLGLGQQSKCNYNRSAMDSLRHGSYIDIVSEEAVSKQLI